MSRPTFMKRLILGQLKRREQALVGGMAGLILGLAITLGVILTGPDVGRPVVMRNPVGAVIPVTIFTLVFSILGLCASVNPPPESRIENGTDVPKSHRKSYVKATIRLKEHATPDHLRALGLELIEWRKGKDAITRISGLDRVLDGLYPNPNGMAPYVEDPDGDPLPMPQLAPDGRSIHFAFQKMKVVDPWNYCHVVIWGDERTRSEEVIESLERSITPALVRSIDNWPTL